MAKKTTSFPKTRPVTDGVLSRQIKTLGESWILAGDIARHSPATLSARRGVIDRLCWFLEMYEIAFCDAHALRRFFKHVADGHKEPGGRWGKPQNTRPNSPGTSATYDRILRTFFTWLIAEGEIEASPMERIPKPIDRPDQLNPFAEEQLLKLLAAAKKTTHPRRNEAILLLMLDTGVRVSELCSLTVADLDLSGATITVHEGKGGKSRVLPIAPLTRKALFTYLKERESDPDEALFQSDRGTTAGGGLTRWGIRLMLTRISKAAGIEGVRCSPHTLRHSFAVQYLKAGGNQFALMNLLGHTDTEMTSRYVKYSQADVAAAHRQFSPVANLKGGKKRGR
jgi:site-specific recombinase XerD